jgi:hypothetical protein
MQFVRVLVGMLTLFLTVPGFASDLKKTNDEGTIAVRSMKTKADKFKSFFASNPKLIDMQSYSKSPTGFIYAINMLKPSGIAYDVQKTDSLVSPFSGYIEVKYQEWDNSKCADKNYHYTTKEAAKANDVERCYTNLAHYSGEINPEYTVRFHFAYQDGVWVFKDLQGSYYGGSRLTNDIYAALGIPTSGRGLSEENKFWEQLVK